MGRIKAEERSDDAKFDSAQSVTLFCNEPHSIIF